MTLSSKKGFQNSHSFVHMNCPFIKNFCDFINFYWMFDVNDFDMLNLHQLSDMNRQIPNKCRIFMSLAWPIYIGCPIRIYQLFNMNLSSHIGYR